MGLPWTAEPGSGVAHKWQPGWMPSPVARIEPSISASARRWPRAHTADTVDARVEDELFTSDSVAIETRLGRWLSRPL
jgi:hypothetical protein